MLTKEQKNTVKNELLAGENSKLREYIEDNNWQAFWDCAWEWLRSDMLALLIETFYGAGINCHLEEIPDGTFCNIYETGDIEDLHLPKTIKKIGREAFYDVNSIRTISGIEYIEEIGDSAFALSELEGVKILNQAVKIGHNAFGYSGSMKPENITLPEKFKSKNELIRIGIIDSYAYNAGSITDAWIDELINKINWV